MMILNMGQIIRSERLKRGMTQEELSFGICTTATLSRIECGLHNPTRAIVSAILQKIGNVDYNFINLEFKPRADISKKKEKIIRYLFSERINTAKDKIEELQALLIEQDEVDQQFLRCAKAFIDIYENNYNLSTYSSLLKMIRMTIINYSQKDSLNYILTMNETFLLVTMAFYHIKNKNSTYAISLLNNIGKSISVASLYPDGGNIFYPMVKKLLGQCYCEEENYESAYTCLQDMINYCRTYGYYDEIALVGKDKAYCEWRLGMHDKLSMTIVSSYYALKAMKLFESAEQLKQFALKHMCFYIDTRYIIGG